MSWTFTDCLKRRILTLKRESTIHMHVKELLRNAKFSETIMKAFMADSIF